MPQPSKIYEMLMLGELPTIAVDILERLDTNLLLLIGDLGTGKTTLTNHLLTLMQSEDSGSSPSYSLINPYKTQRGTVYHMDLYRLETAEEAFAIGIEEYLYSGKLCIIEWPQLIMDHIAPPYQLIKLELTPNNGRRLSLYTIRD